MKTALLRNFTPHGYAQKVFEENAGRPANAMEATE